MVSRVIWHLYDRSVYMCSLYSSPLQPVYPPTSYIYTHTHTFVPLVNLYLLILFREAMKEEVGSFTVDNEPKGSTRSRIRCILLCVTLIILVGLIVVLAIVFGYATDPPGLLVHPTNLLSVNSWDDPKESQKFVDALNAFADTYVHDTVDSKSLAMCAGDEAKGNRECVFSMSWFQIPCIKEERWGFNAWKPCFLLSFNEPRDWVPEPYTSLEELPKEMPKSLRSHITNAVIDGKVPKFLWVSCGGVNPADREFLGEVVLSPWQGFPLYYFPKSHNTPQAATPVLALQVPNAERGVLIGIRCYFWAKNLPSPYIAAEIEYLMN